MANCVTEHNERVVYLATLREAVHRATEHLTGRVAQTYYGWQLHSAIERGRDTPCRIVLVFHRVERDADPIPRDDQELALDTLVAMLRDAGIDDVPCCIGPDIC